MFQCQIYIICLVQFQFLWSSKEYSLYSLWSWYLWNDGEFGPQVMEANISYLDLVNGDLSPCSLQQSEEAECHGGLSSPGASHDTNLYKAHTAL